MSLLPFFSRTRFVPAAAAMLVAAAGALSQPGLVIETLEGKA
jgi:hypothetical protein